ncbi:ABC1 kinase family protein [Alkalihalobacterium elongatum]|uniref:ABC1 kinase family protein n=1 Tax=Alkalihalobacterium elongatum TaxID=2675466 RepID=UPI002E2CB147|nr:AarF/UbiB family protein [Alkalihalobacterium elongatum]
MTATIQEVNTLNPQQIEMIKTKIYKDKSSITASKRTRKIISVMSKHGLAYLLKDASILSKWNKKNRTYEDDVKLHKIGVRLRKVFEELGPTFIKLGQVLVTRQDILPEPITLELEKLLDRVPAMDFEIMQYILETELPQGLDMFEWIEGKPLGSASLAQVYKAKLLDGPVVAVKVLRPTVEKLFETDITVIKKWVKKIQKLLPLELAASLDLNSLVADYYSSSMNELNMQNEARSMNEHRTIAEPYEGVHIAEVYSATNSVLIMEFIDGWTIKDFPVDFFTFEERLELLMDLAHYYIETFLIGNYHADAHGSNIMIDKHTKKAVPIDFGMIGKMDSLHGQAIFRFLMHTRLNQAEDAVECAMDLIQPTIYTDTVKLRDQYRAMFLHYVNSTQGSKYNWGRLVLEIISIGIQNYCKIPNGLALWAKAFSATEGTARWLCPEVSFHHVVESADVQIMKRMMSSRFNYRANASLLQESTKLIGTLPRRLNKILEHLYYNDVKFNLQVKMERSTKDIVQQSVNRLVLAIITASFILATGLMTMNLPSELLLPFLSLQFIAAAFLFISLLLSIFLLWRVWRTRKSRSFF